MTFKGCSVVVVKTQYMLAMVSGWFAIARVFWVVARELICHPHLGVLGSCQGIVMWLLKCSEWLVRHCYAIA